MEILMVCLGNICRSPLAEGILQKIIDEKSLNWKVDSAGTSRWHEGERPHKGSITIAKQYNIDISTQRSRTLTSEDLNAFDIIFAMDDSNYEDIGKLATPANKGKVKHLLSYHSESVDLNLPDPYYTDNFDYVFQLLQDSIENFVAKTLEKKI